MKHILIILSLLITHTLFAQDTLQLMHYNLLNYGNYFGDCTSSTNNVNTKNAHLREIINYVKPDIFTVNEISDNTTYHQLILDQVLNINGDNYRKAVSFNFANSYIVNQLYYNSDKLALYHQDVVIASYRDIDVYTLYYKAGDLAQTNDTIFLTCFVAHLKAGSDASDATSRAGMVANAMSYIRTHDLSDNLLFMGDFNLYTSAEQAYINMTYEYNGIRYFYDPIDREGIWNSNASFADIHTQSTHSGNTDCFSSGGMDSRFDFIMSSEAILNGSNGLKMIDNSYHALGNDGQHYNVSLLDPPTNTSAPGPIIEALYAMSDHLPVLAQLKVDGALGIEEDTQLISAVKFANPCKGILNFEIVLEEAGDIQIVIYDLFGRKHFEKAYAKNSRFINDKIDMSHLANGSYLMLLLDSEDKRVTKKLFLKK